MAEDVEAFLEVHVTIGPVSADDLAGKAAAGGAGKAVRKCIGGSLALGGIYAPDAGVVPFAVAAGSVAVDGR